MLTRPLEKRDYDLIVQVIDRWWGGPTSALAHPIFFYELGDMARIVEDDGVMVGFLLGFIAKSKQGGDVGYVHLVGIHPDHRRRGVGRLLYETFEDDCRKAGVARMKAITIVGQRRVALVPPSARLGHGRDRGVRGPRSAAHRLRQRIRSRPTRQKI